MSTERSELGTFQLKERLGEGAAGTVYRGYDTKLHREVAIKVLTRDFAEDAERLGRFEREARLLATLNHPNVATIHGVEHDEGTDYLVLEYVNGEALDKRLERGGLPLKEALELGIQIASGLEAAHECGVVHRDLKPANICLTSDGRAKVLDFGLAKPIESSESMSSVTTSVGVVLGTPTYMSPEQARGMPLDRRTDVWSFGCVLFELLSGKQAFNGKSVTDLLASILEHEPDWRELPAHTPLRVRDLLERCFDKDPRHRLRDVGDARIQLELALAGDGGPEGPAPYSASGSLVPWMLVAIAGVIAAVAWFRPDSKTAPLPERSTTFALKLPPGDATRIFASLSVSRNGARVAYVLEGTKGKETYVHELSELDPAPLDPPLLNPYNLEFVHDGKWVTYQEDGEFFRAPVTGGASEKLSSGVSFSGYRWIDEDTLISARSFGGPLVQWSKDENKKLSNPVVAPRQQEDEVAVLWPQVVHDGELVLYTSWNARGWNQAQIFLERPADRERTLLVAGGSYGRITTAPDGTSYLLFWRSNELHAARCDLEQMTLVSEPVRLRTELGFSQLEGRALFDISDEGTLVFAKGGPGILKSRIVEIAEDGSRTEFPIPAHRFDRLSVSRDGRRVALDIEGDMYHVATIDLEDPELRLTRRTFDVDSFRALITPSGDAICFLAALEGEYRLYLQALEGGSSPVELIASPNVYAWDFTADDNTLVYRQRGDDGRNRTLVLDLASRNVQELSSSHAQQGRVRISPDGHWSCYGSGEIGSGWNIFIEAFPEGGRKREVSGAEGWSPQFSPDGKSLYFFGEDKVYRASFDPESGETGQADLFYEGSLIDQNGNMAVLPNGNVLLLEPAHDAAAPELELVVIRNLFAELETKLSLEK